MTASAKIIADSISHKGIRLTTLLLKYPRYIHSEFLTHRMLSRNSSSSRAIPISRMMDAILDDAPYPYKGRNQKGMQAGCVLSDIDSAKIDGLVSELINYTIDVVEDMERLGLHKQSANRYLEPYSYISTLVSATEWNNFFALRDHPDAQPEIQELARAIKAAMQNSIPAVLEDTEWHLPFVPNTDELTLKEKLILSVAKCATISFARQDQEMTLQKAKEIYDRLTRSNPIHASPFEHQAKPISDSNEATHVMLADNELWCGNFRGWMQHRRIIPNNYKAY